MSIERLHTVLTRADLPTTGRELAEILWLAGHLPGPAGSSAEDPPDERPADREPERRPEVPTGRTEPDRPPGGEEPRRPAGARHELHAPSADGGGGADARGVLAPAAPMLGDVLRLQRALRPLKRRVPSRRRDLLDEAATAAFIADQPAASRLWIPVLTASPERWLDLALVADTGPSMRVWRPLLRELRAALTQLGAFRDVRIWHLAGTDTRLGVSTAPANGQVLDPSALLDPSTRRVVLVLSDCSGRHWWDGRAGHALHTWACHGPAAILQPLPDRLWYRTAAPATPGLAAPTRACAPSTALRFTPYEGAVPAGAVPVPVLGLTADWLADWARLVAGVAGDGLPTTVTHVTHGRRSRLAVVQRDRELPVEERVMLFQATASPAAVRLAAHVAVSTPTLPVMRLVQRALLPSSRPSDLAEVVLSGLLRPAAGDPDRYEFVDDARAALLATLPRSESWHAVNVLREVSAQIEARAGSAAATFRALLPVPEGTGDVALGAGAGPVALISQEALRLLGHTAIPTLPRQLPYDQPPPAPTTPAPTTPAAEHRAAEQRVEDGRAARPVRSTAPRDTSRARADHVPHTLPRDVPTFTGRAQARSLLTDLPAALDDAHTVAITGMPGVGKTALAVHSAHELAPRYPDGQLFLDLRGHRPGEAPLAPAEALRRLLAMLRGADDIEPSADPESLTRRWRAATEDRRLLVVLDDAASAQQLAPLLTGGHGSLTLVTSRRALPGPFLRVPLDVPPRDEALSLLTRLVREERVQREPEAAAALVELCGRLPLAIRLIASRLATSRADQALAAVVERMAGGRLDELRTEDRSLRDVFRLSYGELDKPQRRLLRRLGLHPTGEFDIRAAAALGDLRTEARAETLLTALTDAGLLTVTGDRYRMHVLLHEYARERLDAEESPGEHTVIATRILDHYLLGAVAAHAKVRPYRRLDGNIISPKWWVPDLRTAEAALEWFDRERATLLACPVLAVDHGRPEAWRIPRAIGHYLNLRGHLDVAETVCSAALGQAEENGDRKAIADLTALTADTRRHQGRRTSAIDLYLRAEADYVRLGELRPAADMAVRIGICHRLAGELDRAEGEFTRARNTFVTAGDLYGEMEVRRELGLVAHLRGHHVRARQLTRRSLLDAERLGDPAAIGACSQQLELVIRAAETHDDRPGQGPARRTVLVCDIASFGDPRRTDRARAYVRESMYQRLRRSFDRSEVPFEGCHTEDRGDGLLVVPPPEVDVAVLLSPLMDRLDAELRAHNELSSEIAQIRLRVGLHIGVIHTDAHGVVGTAVNHVFRLLEAPSFKAALQASGAQLGVIVSETVYQDVIGNAPGLVDPADYRPHTVQVKETTARAWIRIPGERGSTVTTGHETARSEDPAATLLQTPEVPENLRFCRQCSEQVGRGQSGRPGLLEGFCPRCGSRYSFVPALRPGDLVAGQYETAGVLARGGQGWVHLARDHNVGERWVVLKSLLQADDPLEMAVAVAERRFLAEIDHPNIARVHNFVEHPDPATGATQGYVVMEYVAGRTLREMLLRRRAEHGHTAVLPLGYVLSCGIEILRALGYLHSRGLVYCDLKPDNVIASADGVKLIDLSAIRRMDDERSPVYGTTGYQAPEIAAIGPTVASDLYTVGRTLAVLSLPVTPFGSPLTSPAPGTPASGTPVPSTPVASTRSPRNAGDDAFAPRLPSAGDLPLLRRYASFDRLLRRATDLDPGRRFGTAEEMIEQLRAIRQEVEDERS